MFYYFFLDYRRPYAVCVYLGLFVVFSAVHGLACLIAEVARHEDIGWWTAPGIMLATLGLMRFRNLGPYSNNVSRISAASSPKSS